MKKMFFLISIIVSVNITYFCYAYQNSISPTETIIFIRHGEKPLDKEIGQLNCQGLNRSLKLPKLLFGKFGKPDYIYAPNPSKEIGKKDQKEKYSYNRPLATIEPTAIQFGLPVNAQIGFTSVKEMASELMKSKFKESLIFVSWEHKKLVDIVRKIYSMDINNRAEDIPNWRSGDYDSIYILKVIREDNFIRVNFTKDSQNLNGQSEICP